MIASKYFRRASLSLFTVCMTLFGANAAAQPDLILHNGTIYTVDDADRVVEAVAIDGGRIVETGANDAVLALAGDGTRRIDLAGRTVLPGLIDCHGHLMNLGFSLQNLDFVGTTSLDEITRMVAVRAESARPGEWILGRGWDQNDWVEKAFPNHESLSDVSPNNPVYLTRVDGHAGFANARAMEIAGFDENTPDPSGGKIHRDETGAPTGVLIDTAQGLVRRHIPPASDAQQREAVALAIQECLRYGLTSVHDAGVSGETIDLYKALVDEDNFDLRVYAMISAGSRDTLDAYFESGPLMNYGEHRLAVRSVKAMADGALGSRGAALLEPYADDPGNAGLMVTPEPRLWQVVKAALEHGFQLCTHAIGDKANRMVLDAYEDGFTLFPKIDDHRFRIEHAQVVALEDIPRFAKLGVIPSIQATHATSDMYWAEDRVGPERVKGAYAWRRFIETGARIANGSDFPVEGVNPLWGVYASVTRQDHKGWPEGGWQPDQRLTRQETLRSFTIDAAYAAFEEDVKGSIVPGKLADLVVLSKDVMKIPPEEILDTKVEMTILGGKIVHENTNH